MTSPSLDLIQQRFLYQHGYVVVPSAVPAALVVAARRLLNLDIGRLWLRAQSLEGSTDATSIDKLQRTIRSTRATESDPAILALLNETPIKPILEHALGAQIPMARGAQIATLFPSRPNERINESGYRDADTPFYGWHGHLDGLWCGATPVHQRTDRPMSEEEYARWSASPALNGVDREFPEHGTTIKNFTALVGIALSDQREEGAGNLGVLAGAHHAIAAFFRKQRALGGPLGPEGPDWPRLDASAPNGYGLVHYPEEVRQAFAKDAARTADGKLWPKPTLIRMAPGDAVIALHGLPHCGTRVEGPDPRLMVYFRVTSSARPKANRQVYPDTLCDPWIEWLGIGSAARG